MCHQKRLSLYPPDAAFCSSGRINRPVTAPSPHDNPLPPMQPESCMADSGPPHPWDSNRGLRAGVWNLSSWTGLHLWVVETRGLLCMTPLTFSALPRCLRRGRPRPGGSLLPLAAFVPRPRRHCVSVAPPPVQIFPQLRSYKDMQFDMLDPVRPFLGRSGFHCRNPAAFSICHLL